MLSQRLQILQAGVLWNGSKSWCDHVHVYTLIKVNYQLMHAHASVSFFLTTYFSAQLNHNKPCSTSAQHFSNSFQALKSSTKILNLQLTSSRV